MREVTASSSKDELKALNKRWIEIIRAPASLDFMVPWKLDARCCTVLRSCDYSWRWQVISLQTICGDACKTFRIKFCLSDTCRLGESSTPGDLSTQIGSVLLWWRILHTVCVFSSRTRCSDLAVVMKIRKYVFVVHDLRCCAKADIHLGLRLINCFTLRYLKRAALS